MSVPMFISIYNNGHIWVNNQADQLPTSAQEAGTLVTTIKVNSDAAMQKITTLSGTVSSSLSATGGTGATGSRFTTKELT